MTHLRFASAVLLTSFVLGCAELEVENPSAMSEPLLREGLRREVVGCYRWVGPGMNEDVFPVLALDSLPVEQELPRYRQLNVSSSEMRRHYNLRSWSADSLTDSIRVHLSTGFGGEAYVLHGSGDTLRGYRATFTDVAPELRREEAMAIRRVPCPASVHHPGASPSGVGVRWTDDSGETEYGVRLSPVPKQSIERQGIRTDAP